jgi:DivIVA domain-containing protein
MTGDQVRDTLFWPPYLHGTGYDAGEVDDLVRRVAAEIDAGQPAGPVIENAMLRRRMRGRRYDIDAVDWFLSQLLLPLGCGVTQRPRCLGTPISGPCAG